MNCRNCEYWALAEDKGDFKACYRQWDSHSKFKSEGQHEVIVTLADFGCNQFLKRVASKLDR